MTSCHRPALLLAVASTVIAVSVLAPAAGASPTAAQSTCGGTSASPQLQVTPTQLRADATTTITITGRNYLVPPHVCGNDVFGGVYVFFGWVAPGGQWGPSWRAAVPSNPYAGLYGASYNYPGEGGGGETRDDGTGILRLVSFTAGGLSGQETDFHMDGAGNWQTTLVVRGATYRWRDVVTGASNTVDCRVVQCGVYTIGAHGKSSRTNEVFTPITFTSPPSAPVPSAPTAPTPPSGGGGTVAPAAPGSPTAPVTAAPERATTSPRKGSPRVTVPTTTVAPGATPPPAEVGGASTSAAPSTTTTTEVERSSSAKDEHDERNERAAALIEDDGGSSTGAVAAGAAVVALAALATGGVLLRRRRGAAS